MKISAIVAYSLNRAIGKDNKLLWHLKKDMLNFKKITKGKTVLMGSNTYYSLPLKYRPLPDRLNLVLSSKVHDESFDNLKFCSSIEEALDYSKSQNIKEIIVIGGEQIYNQFIDKYNTIYATEIDVELEGDTFFPEIDLSKYNIVNSEPHSQDADNEYCFRFVEYEKNS